MPHILVCTDGSVYAESVYDHAAWTAKRVGGSVEVLHVLDHHREQADSADYSGNMEADGREVLLDQLVEADEAKSKTLKARGREILKVAAEHFAALGIGSIKRTLRNGTMLETLTEIETEADLVVIGKRGEAADFVKLDLGENLENAVRGCKHPVLVVSRAFKPINKVMIAYDGGATSRKALDWAANDALLKDLDIVLLKVGEDNKKNRALLSEAEAQLEHTAGKITSVLKSGPADVVIADLVKSEGIDLMVVGAYGQSRIRQWIVGSTTTTLIRTCQVPLLMVR